MGEFRHLEDQNLTWEYMKDKISQNALLNGADFIKIDKYNVLGIHTDGHSAKITGRYFRSTNLTLEHNNSEHNGLNEKGKFIYVFRNEGAAFLRSAFPINIFLDGKEIGEIPNNSYYAIKIDVVGKHILSTSKNGNNALTVDIEQNQNQYISVTQNISSSNLGVNIGNKNFRVFDSLEGRLNFETVKSEGKKNN